MSSMLARRTCLRIQRRDQNAMSDWRQREGRRQARSASRAHPQMKRTSSPNSKSDSANTWRCAPFSAIPLWSMFGKQAFIAGSAFVGLLRSILVGRESRAHTTFLSTSRCQVAASIELKRRIARDGRVRLDQISWIDQSSAGVTLVAAGIRRTSMRADTVFLRRSQLVARLCGASAFACSFFRHVMFELQQMVQLLLFSILQV